VAIDRERDYRRGAWQIAIALTIQFDIGGECFDELRHHHVRQDDTRYDHVGAWQVAHKIKNELGTASDDDHTSADISPGNMLRNTGSNGGDLIVGIRTILG
jgi:hypothetical protein